MKVLKPLIIFKSELNKKFFNQKSSVHMAHSNMAQRQLYIRSHIFLMIYWLQQTQSNQSLCTFLFLIFLISAHLLFKPFVYSHTPTCLTLYMVHSSVAYFCNYFETLCIMMEGLLWRFYVICHVENLLCLTSFFTLMTWESFLVREWKQGKGKGGS